MAAWPLTAGGPMGGVSRGSPEGGGGNPAADSVVGGGGKRTEKDGF